VVAQTRRRIVDGESVPATKKLVSIFEPHTDIIIKDRRATLYGHKLCLATGASGLITDCRIEKGNPADSTLAVEMVQRHTQLYQHPPSQVCFRRSIRLTRQPGAAQEIRGPGRRVREVKGD
jgi:IS5 family transposase